MYKGKTKCLQKRVLKQVIHMNNQKEKIVVKKKGFWSFWLQGKVKQLFYPIGKNQI